MTEAEQAAYERGRADERADVVAWLNECRAFHEANSERRGQIIARRHHIDACRGIAAAITRRKHMKGTDNG